MDIFGTVGKKGTIEPCAAHQRTRKFQAAPHVKKVADPWSRECVIVFWTWQYCMSSRDYTVDKKLWSFIVPSGLGSFNPAMDSSCLMDRKQLRTRAGQIKVWMMDGTD